jgi:hypothetical protein
VAGLPALYKGRSMTEEDTRRIDRIKPYAEAAAAVVGILGVFFLVWQVFILNSQTESLKSQTQSLKEQVQQAYRNDAFSKSLELDKLIFDNPTEYQTVVAAGKGSELMKKGKTNPEELAKTQALAVYVADFFDYILELFPVQDYPELAPSSKVPHDNSYVSYLAWSNTIRSTFQDKSLLCETLIKNRDNYGSGFTSRLKSATVCPGL